MAVISSLGIQHLSFHSAADVQETFRLLGYDLEDLYAYQGDELNQFEFDEVDRDSVRRVYIIGGRERHTVYLFEVDDLHQTRLRGLAWNVLQRGTGLLVVTRDYREVLFVDPRFVGISSKSNVRVNKLKVITGDPTRHDLDTLNNIHAHRRTGQEIYDAQAEAFNVNTVTNRFYREYKTYYDRARDAAVQYNPGIREFYDADKLHAFTQRLLGRLMFLYFLQRKGWLGGRQKFLTEQYRETMRRHAGEINEGESSYYYREVLEPLFFDTLNAKRPDNVTRWQGLRIPYLNGGLFDHDRDPQGIITLPDALFDPNSDQGVLAFFNRYNFTVADDTPLEQDVAVDPEMLGKVFENMLEERDRGQSGSFYTPRAIVSYMCQEALAGYLEESANVSREAVRAIFDPDTPSPLTAEEAQRVNAALDTLTVLDPAVGSGSFLIGMMGEIIRLRTACAGAIGQDVTPALVADWKERIIRDTLYGVDIKPEAIEIAQLRLWLALVVDQTLEQARPLPNLDYRLMAGNSLIETVDGQPILGELAARMLQTQGGTAEWEQVNDQLKLFDPNPVQSKMMLFESDRESLALPELRERFFRASPEERKKLREEIAALERRIVFAGLKERGEAYQTIINGLGKMAAQTGGRLKPADKRKLEDATARLKRITDVEEELKKPDGRRPFFLYRLHFSEVFAAKGGFDIVIANPPYVRGELLADQKPELKVSYPDVYAGTADLYVYFFARAYDLLRPAGQLSFITSNKYLRANYGKGLRRFLSENVHLNAIMDFGDLPVFEAAAYPCIVLADKQAQPAEAVPAAAVRDMAGLEDLRGALAGGVRLNQRELGENEWQISSGAVQRVFAKLKMAGVPLGKYVDGKIYRGVLTGFNEAFVIDGAKRAELIAADPNSADLIKPWLRGRDVKRWRIDARDLYLIAIQNSSDDGADNAWAAAKTEVEARAIFRLKYPAIHDHLSQYEEPLRIRQDQGRWWWELRACAYYEVFEEPKIIYQEIATFQAFAFAENSFYANNKCFILPSTDLFLLALLNSATTWFFLGQIISKLRGDAYAMQYPYVSQLPIPDALPELRERIATLARRCLEAAQSSPESLPALEAELNALVYQAYGLDADDIAVIEGYLGSSEFRVPSAELGSTEETNEEGEA
ncbi:MAG: Eco57I restriction-modification methylase domain-containing protein [Chloroflexi bacterium]|nr:Eco57I restriction-modification methylase domain-containing protein [Chloroflexota bacterium]